MTVRDESIQKITQMARHMRINLLKMALAVGGNSHIGGGLSIIDITATLFGAVMSIDSQDPKSNIRDRFILSKGHGILGYYTALAEVGYISEDMLMQFEKTDSPLMGHPVMNRNIGIEFSTGSLGMGLSLGIGVALGFKKKAKTNKVFVLLGDGECNEGSVWEGFLSAAHFKLDNLTIIIDRNTLQQTGANQDIMNLGDMGQKLSTFGWNVKEVNGHKISELYDAFTNRLADERPQAIIAHTIKGKGLRIAENNNDWHHAQLTQIQFQTAIHELESLGG